MFDPNKVRRFKDCTCADDQHCSGDMVLAADYDLLLALYTSESDARRLLGTKLAISSNTFAENKLRPRWPWDSKKASADDEISGEPV